MSEFIITKEVIESIRIAREVQLQESPVSKQNRGDLALLAINNGEQKRFVLEYKKLCTWINTFSGRELGEVKVRFEERNFSGEMLVVNLENSEIAFVSQNPKEVLGDPIELQVIDGIAQRIETIDKDELKRVKKLNAQRKKQKKLTKDIRGLEYRINSKNAAIEREGKKVEEARGFIASHSLNEALENALLRRDRAREFRRVKGRVEERKPVLLDLIDLGVIDPFEQDRFESDEDGVNFIHQASIVTYNSYVERLVEAENHLMKYKPRKSWSKSATKEREKRQERVDRAFRDLKWFIDRLLISWTNELLEVEVSGYQEQRNMIRSWPSCEKRLKSEIESLELDLEAKRRELERIEEVAHV